MSKKTDQQKELKALLNLIETNSRSLLGEFEKNFIAQQILLQNEQNRLTRKGKNRYSPRIRQLSIRQKKHEMFADQIIVLKQSIEISPTPPPKKGVLVQGLVTDDRVMGISKFAGRNIYVSLVNEDKKPIPGISTKRCKTDASGYFSIILTQKDIKLLTKEKIVPKLLVEDGNGKVIKEFVTPPLSKISKIPSTRRITANISFTSNEMVKQKAKRTKEAKLKAAEMRKREEIREHECEEKRKREEAERLKLVEDTKKKILKEVAKKREAERKKFEKETLERLKAEMEEKMRAKESEIEKETRKN